MSELVVMFSSLPGEIFACFEVANSLDNDAAFFKAWFNSCDGFAE